MTPEMFFDYLAVHINGQKAGDAKSVFNIDLGSDGGKYKLELEICVPGFLTINMHSQIVEEHFRRHRPNGIRACRVWRWAFHDAVTQLLRTGEVEVTPRPGFSLVAELLQRIRFQVTRGPMSFIWAGLTATRQRLMSFLLLMPRRNSWSTWEALTPF